MENITDTRCPPALLSKSRRNATHARSILRQLRNAAVLGTIVGVAGIPNGCEAPGSSHNAGAWGRADLVEDLRIGVLEGPDEYIFGRVGHLAVGADGSIYVADAQLGSIRQYDAAGHFVRTIGSQGQGPGEYSRILGMKMLHDGTLAVLDAPHKIILYSRGGAYQRDFRVPSTLYASRMLEYDVAGNLYTRATEGDIARGTADWPFILIKMSPQGEVQDRIALPKEERSGESFVLHTSDGPVWYPTVSTRHAWSPLGYLVVGRNDDYAFELRRTDEPLRVEREVDPVPLADGERDMWRAWASHMERGAREQGRATTYPTVSDVKPVYKDLYVGEDGRIWVHRHVAAEKRDLPPRAPGDDRPLLDWREPTTFDVFDPDGTFLGTVVVPQNTIIYVWNGRQLWGVQTGDAGEQVVRFRVETASG